MNKKYIFLAFLIFALAGGLLLLPEKNNYQQIDPEELMIDVMQPTRLVTTDQVARILIEGDPTFRLVDLRPEKEFTAFSLPGSVNIPIDSLLQESSTEMFNMEEMNMILYENDDIQSDQAWVVLKRLGYKNIYVMKGGLNMWVNTIIRPESPAETAESEEFDLYEFRKGASLYFTGSKIETTNIKSDVKIEPKKKASVKEGGC